MGRIAFKGEGNVPEFCMSESFHLPVGRNYDLIPIISVKVRILKMLRNQIGALHPLKFPITIKQEKVSFSIAIVGLVESMGCILALFKDSWIVVVGG